MWPPLGAMQVRMAEPGHSCKQVCQEEQLICEPSFFQHLNKDKDLARWDTCTQKQTCLSVDFFFFFFKVSFGWQQPFPLPSVFLHSFSLASLLL